MSKRAPGGNKSGIQLIEEVFNTAKCLPMSTWVTYYAFTFPFVLGFLYFWSDMGNHAFAYTRLPVGATMLTFLFIAAKTGHILFNRQVTMRISGYTEPPPMSVISLPFNQLILQSTGLIILPIALILLVPFGKVYAFYQNLSVLDDGQRPLRELIQDARVQARWEPKQNLVMIWLLCPYVVMFVAVFFYLILPVMHSISPQMTDVLLMLYSLLIGLALIPLCPFGMVVALNLGIAFIALPHLAKTFFGLESVFTISPSGMTSSIFFAIVVSMTYLCLDPLIKIAYCIRCFYASSIHDGKDLKLKLEQLTKSSAVVLVVALSSMIFAPQFAHAQEEPSPESIAQIESESLDAAIGETLKDRKFAWRIPRERPEDVDAGFFAFLANTTNDIVKWVKKTFIDSIADWFDKYFNKKSSTTSSSNGSSSPIATRSLVTILLVILSLALLYTGWKTWKSAPVVELEAVVAESLMPDLEDEDTTAEALPSDEWFQLAEKLRAQGETRLAMRAYFFAGLAQLAYRQYIRLASHKSNRDYLRELLIIAHAHGEIHHDFNSNLGIFESVWYGNHAISESAFTEYIHLQERLGHHA